MVQWETLAGFAAAAAAYWNVLKLARQIQQTQELAEDQRRRRARAARAILPLTLSEISEYATASIKGLYALKPCFLPDGSLDQAQAEDDPRKWTVPRLPDNVLSVLKECIEFSEDDQAKGLIDLVCQFQKQNRRLIDDIAMIRLNDVRRLLLWANIEESIVDAAELYARASVLFPFAKGKTNQIFDIKRNLIYNACFVSGCFETLEEIDRLADRWELGFPHRRKMEEMGLQSLGLSTVQVGEGSTARLPPI